MRTKWASWLWLLAAAAFAIYAGVSSYGGFRYNFDIVAYIGLVQEDGQDIAALQQSAYRELAAHAPPGQFRRITRAAGYRQTLFTDPEAYRQNLNWYRPRPAYIAVLRAMRAAGVDTVEAIKLVSSTSIAGLVLICFAWLRRFLGPFAAFLATAVGAIAFDLVAVGEFATPDSLSGMVTLGALFALTGRGVALFWTGQALLLLSVFVRSDMAAFVVLFELAYLLRGSQERIFRAVSAATAVAAVASFFVINRLAGHYGWPKHFQHSFLGSMAYPATEPLTLTAIEYRRFLVHRLTSGFPTVFWTAALCGAIAICVRAKGPGSGLTSALAIAAGGGMLVRFVAYPSLETRFFAAIYILVLVTLVSRACDTGPTSA